MKGGRRGLVLLGALAVLGGCPPPAPEGPPKPRPPTDGELAARVMQTYQAWQASEPPQECSVYFAACADAFARQAGFDPQDLAAKNPRSFMQNPDPQWIPGWDRIPADAGHRHFAFGALAYAAVTKRFFTSCHRDFDAADLARAEEAQRLRGELEAIDKLENPYARLGRLVTYRREVKRRFDDPVGPRYALELAVFERFSKAGRSFLYELQNQRSEDAASFRPAFTNDEERDLFCMNEGIPTWQDTESVPAAFVAIPIPAARQTTLEEKAKAARDLEAKLPAAERKLAELHVDTAPEKGTQVFIGKEVLAVPLSVNQIKEGKDGVLTLELGGKLTLKDARYDCKTTDKIEKIVEGKPVYAEECKKREEVREVVVTVRLPERPDVAIQKGDVVTLVGTVTKAEARSPKAGPKAQVVHKLELDAVHVFEIWRDRLLVADYFVQ